MDLMQMNVSRWHKYVMDMTLACSVGFARLEWRLYCLAGGGEHEEVDEAASMVNVGQGLTKLEVDQI